VAPGVACQLIARRRPAEKALASPTPFVEVRGSCLRQLRFGRLNSPPHATGAAAVSRYLSDQGPPTRGNGCGASALSPTACRTGGNARPTHRQARQARTSSTRQDPGAHRRFFSARRPSDPRCRRSTHPSHLPQRARQGRESDPGFERVRSRVRESAGPCCIETSSSPVSGSANRWSESHSPR
jgi:hypothetical protein